jgi:diaminopimelate epimerase
MTAGRAAHRLTKHHGLGNDFLVLLTDDPDLASDRAGWVARAPIWCDRRRGVGADGLLVGAFGAAAGDGLDLAMTLVNADGSVAEMSGNGIRCLAQAEAMRRGQAEGVLEIGTDAGVRRVTFRPDPDGQPATIVASVEMGGAGPGPEPDRSVDVRADEVGPAAAEALALAPTRRATYDLGNPHLVLLVEDPDVIDVVAAGSTHEAAFDSGMNVHFVSPTPGEPDAMTMRVWERGAGVTEACGTGAAAVARAAHDWGLTGPRVRIHMPGGDVTVDVGDEMVLHGPATYVATIEVPA